MTGGDDECRTLSRRVWGRLELTSGRAYQELPEESRGKQASRAPSKRTRAGHEGGLTGLPPSKRTRSAGKAHHERTADPSRLQGSLNNLFGSQILNWIFEHRIYLAVGV